MQVLNEKSLGIKKFVNSYFYDVRHIGPKSIFDGRDG